jgi:hypothetical protein
MPAAMWQAAQPCCRARRPDSPGRRPPHADRAGQRPAVGRTGHAERNSPELRNPRRYPFAVASVYGVPRQDPDGNSYSGATGPLAT